MPYIYQLWGKSKVMNKKSAITVVAQSRKKMGLGTVNRSTNVTLVASSFKEGIEFHLKNFGQNIMRENRLIPGWLANTNFLNVSGTTNATEGHFADLKTKLRNRNGLSIERKKKFIDEFLKA